MPPIGAAGSYPKGELLHHVVHEVDGVGQTEFIERVPSLESYWRSVILFGNNVASCKFALGKSLLELADADDTFIPLARLAEPLYPGSREVDGDRPQITALMTG
jgi:hypothetical protein